MLLIEFNHHFDDFVESREGEFKIKDADSSRRLVLLNAKLFKLI